MATINLTYDTDSQSITSASFGGREFRGTDIVSVVLSGGIAQIIDATGQNLLEEQHDAPLGRTKAQLDVALAFGVDSPLADGGEWN
ncbi:unnamed protein product [Gemmata massiliana]|uniref:Uncharacterized protein n=1 Tax=Gemmata massiliana TaxID=1210884 RepID=A0A6P2D506_9BACT|nr:hypothetical protein [Gemmata massiliana]VTR96143.1 unnamed protein product [Gemmata massiliana]